MKKEKRIKLIKRIVTVAIFAVAILIVYGYVSCTGEKNSTVYENGGTATEFQQNGSDDAVGCEVGTDMEEKTNSSNNHENFTEKTQENEYSYLAVYVCGAVKKSGVYFFEDGARVDDAIKSAGGLSEDASELSVNRADKLTDGQMIVVLTRAEYEANSQSLTALDSGTNSGSDMKPVNNGKVDINAAGQAELMTIPGIGEAKAKAIIAYRQDNGRFSSVEDIKNVDGIADGIFSKIKDYIIVK